jgi:hypothetical protein
VEVYIRYNICYKIAVIVNYLFVELNAIGEGGRKGKASTQLPVISISNLFSLPFASFVPPFFKCLTFLLLAS